MIEQLHKSIHAAVQAAVEEEVEKAIKIAEAAVRARVAQIAVRIFQQCSMEKYGSDQIVIKFELEKKK